MMMDKQMQAIVDAILSAGASTRSQYQLTLGKAIAVLDDLPDRMKVECDNGRVPGEADSYRGYYADLAFSPSGPVNKTILKFRRELKAAMGSTFQGYKGGDFTMGAETPLWLSDYGTASGIAMMDIVERDGKAIIITKQVD